ncbi:ATP cone domain-containing protein [bacterium]|nr:ATP cone domain-containing protein [bacterium]
MKKVYLYNKILKGITWRLGMNKIIKRDGSIEVFSKVKIQDAIYKVTVNSEKGIDKELGKNISNKVEEIQDLVEVLLMESNRKDVAKHYILYREKRANIRSC